MKILFLSSEKEHLDKKIIKKRRLLVLEKREIKETVVKKNRKKESLSCRKKLKAKEKSLGLHLRREE